MDLACLVVLLGALAWSTVTDLRRRAIPNGCALAVALSGLALGAAEGVPARSLAGGLVALAVLLLAAWASARRAGAPGVGGGDVKLLSALGLWLGPVTGLAAVALSCLLGVVGWALAVGARRLWRRSEGESPCEDPAGLGIPMAPAIALAALLALPARMGAIG